MMASLFNFFSSPQDAMRAARSLILAMISALFLAVSVSAQVNVLDSDPIAARKRLVYTQVGGFVGIGGVMQTGTITTDCQCDFNGGGGTQFAVGAVVERLTRSQLIWGVALGYDRRGLTGQFTEIEGVLQRSPSGREFTVPMTFLNEADMALDVVTVAPYLKMKPFGPVFVRAGASLGYVVSSTLVHRKTLTTSDVVFPNGEVATAELVGVDGTSVVLQNGPVSDLQPLQLGLFGGVGVDVSLSKKLTMTPMLQYFQPLTSISAQGTGFSARSFQFLLELRHIL
jgi:hypothetical protein